MQLKYSANPNHEMASSSTSFTLKEAGFHIRNVPKEWNDWNMFAVFRHFGRVGYCRIASQAHDGLSQTAFVSMLSVEEADVVRKNLVDGCLPGDSFSLRVQDLKQNISHLLHKPSAPVAVKNAPVRLCSSWLPLNKEVEIEVVDYLPSSATPVDLFGLTVVQVNCKPIDERYEMLKDKLNHYASLQPFENDNVLAIGYDGVYREGPKLHHRCRRLSATKLYLLDIGIVVNFDKTAVFQLPKVFQYLPTKVALCGLDGLTWSPAAIPSFDKVREVVKQWGQIEKTPLYAVAVGFEGPLNMISLYCGKSILAERLQRKGACEYLPRHKQPKYIYTRDDLMKQKNTEKTAKISNDADVVKDLLKEIDGVKAMLRDLNLAL